MARSQVQPSTQKSRRQAQASRPRRSARLQQNNRPRHLLPSPPTTSSPDLKLKVPQCVPSPLDPECIHPWCPPDEFETNRKIGRKRKRSQEVEDLIPQDQEHRQLPSPPIGTSHERSSRKKSKKAVSQRPYLEETHNRYPEKRKAPQQTPQQRDTNTYNRVAHWAHTSFWPKDLWQGGFEMDDTSSKKRKTDSTHRSSGLRRMAKHGVFMENSKLIQKDSKSLCEEYLKGDRTTVKSSIFTAEEFSKVLERVRNSNEARITRDVTPWIVPSAEVLFFRDELKLNYIGDELNAEWIRCATMGGTRPKPDYTAGLLQIAFTEEEINKLENYAQPARPFRFTPELSFPFLMCEAKTGEVGLNEADRQNIHSASIAVRAIIVLYQTAFGHTAPHRVHELYGKVLVFTVSHDNDRVLLYGHFAIAKPNFPTELKFYRHPIALFSLTIRDGADRYQAYNFVWNVYEKFAPDHRKRIKDAVAQLESPAERTGLSFVASNITVNEPDSEQDSQETPSQGEGYDEFLMRQEMPPPSNAGTTESEQVQRLEQENATLNERIEQMNVQLNSFISSNLRTNSGNGSEVVTMLRQENERQRQENERQRQENERQRREMKEENERQRQEMREENRELKSLLERMLPVQPNSKT
ncbi:MAG: hypothetical protein Q9217_003898 [Psora testacea]